MNKNIRGFLKINLQLFAQDDGSQGGNSENSGGAENQGNQNSQSGEQGKSQDGKYYTQEEIDTMMAKRAKRAKDNAINEYKNSDEYKDFKKFLEDNKTSEQKHKDMFDELENIKLENQKLQKQISDYENVKAISGKGVEEKYHKFVNFEVKQMVSDDKDFSTALDEFLKDNPDYIGGTTTGMTTGQRKNNGTTQSDLDELRKAMGVYRPTK